MSGKEQQEGTVVAEGKYVVPNGVVVEELDGGKTKLLKECPKKLVELLSAKNLVPIYDTMVNNIVNRWSTYDRFGNWKDMNIVSILDKYRDQFADKAVKVVLCKRESAAGTYHWLEFIDKDTMPSYVPQYDVNNLSDQTIKTVYTTLRFPNGVAVQKFKKLKKEIPPHVQEMMERKGLMNEYDTLVNQIVGAHEGFFRGWNMEKIFEIITSYNPMFEDKGVAIFVSYKEEWVNGGHNSEYMARFRWLEFVDREVQPNYFPQRSADSKKEKCVIQ